MTVTFTGVPKNSVGSRYNCAIGFDSGSGVVEMVGYVIPKGTMWQQDANLQDESSLIAVASPNQVDRNLTTWPRVSQGDWSHGEQQLTYIDPARYRSSDGFIDVSTPGALTLLPSARTTTKVQGGTYQLAPLVTDGGHWFLGYYKDNSVNFLQADLTGYNPPVEQQVCDGTEILDMLYFVGHLAVGTNSGIWAISDATEPGPPTSTLISTTGVSHTASKAMAYYGESLYFIDPTDTTIYYVAPGDTFPITFQTKGVGTYETNFGCICSSANGIFYTTRQLGADANEVLYLYDGASASSTRIGDIWGRVLGAAELFGYTYILCLLAQGINKFDLTLMQLSGTTLSVVQGADFRFIDPEFQAQISSTGNTRAHLYGDGRYVYLGWPGMPGLRIDITQGGVSRIGPNASSGQYGVNSHRLIYTNSFGAVDVVSYGTTLIVNELFQNPTSGTITLSDFDLDTPAEHKIFKAVLIELNAPLDPNASVVVSTDVDATGTYSSTNLVTISPTKLMYLIPGKKIGCRISIQLTLTADSASHKSPSIRSVSLDATLSRVWKATLQCHAGEQLLDNSTDDNNAMKLLSNLQNAYDNAGRRVYMYVPSLTDSSGVEVVIGEMADYSYKAPGPSIQGTVDVTVKETA